MGPYNREAEESKSEKACNNRRSGQNDVEPGTKECGQPLKPRNGKETDPPLKPSKGMHLY